jgi:hypothetical protein
LQTKVLYAQSARTGDRDILELQTQVNGCFLD